MKPIVLFGAGGHAKVVADVIERQALYEIAFVLDDDPALEGKRRFGYEVLGGRESFPGLRDARRIVGGVVGIGDNGARMKVADWAGAAGLKLVRAVHPSAQLGRGVIICEGAAVMAGAVINSDARIGRNVIVNTGATVDHDCELASGVHIGPGCHLCGNVTVLAGSAVGAGTIIIPGVTVGRDVVIGAGSTVLRDVPDGAKVAGSPCAPI